MRLATCWVGVFLLVATAAAPAPEPESPGRPDPVELLRRALRAPARDVEARELQVRAAVGRLHSLDELGRGLLLNEWRDRDPDETVAAVDGRHRKAVVERFERGVRAALRQGDLDGRLGTLGMVGGLDGTVRGAGEAPLTHDLTADLAGLTCPGPAALRASAARALGCVNPEPRAAAAALGELLRDPDPGLRAVAGESLGGMVATAVGLAAVRGEGAGGPEEVVPTACAVVPAAAAGLADASAEVRRRCAEALGRAAGALAALVRAPGVPDAVEDWEAYRRGVDEERAALRPLVAALREQSGALARAAGDGDARVRVVARHALEDVAEARVRLLRRASSAVAAAPGQGDRVADGPSVAFLLEDPLLEGLRQALPALAAGVEDADVEARRASIDVLEALGRHAAPAGPALVRALSDRDRFVRWAAARALGKVRPASAEAVVPHLARLLGDGDRDLRLAAAGALREYGPAARAALPALVEAAQAREPEMRLAVLRALESIGSEDAAALAVLSAGLTDADARVRQVAAQALEKLGPSRGHAANALLRPPARNEGVPAKAVGSARPR